MKKISKKILSFVLSFVMILTMGMSGVVTESAKAADSANTVSLVYRGGANNYVQVNTDLPVELKNGLVAYADTPGCDFKQEGTLNVNQVNLNVTDEPNVVLSFVINEKLSANDTIMWKKGTVFSFDDTKYMLDADYTFTWDGSAWNARKDCIMDMTLHSGADSYLQTRHTLPEGLVFDNLKSTLDYESSTKVPKDRISFPKSNIMSINFGADYTCAEGDTFTWKAGSAFAFSMTNQYVYYTLQNTWVFTFTNNSWKTKVEVAVESVEGANYYLQPILNISSTDNGDTLSHTFNEAGGTLNNKGIGSYNRNGQALLSVNLKETATVGDTYVWNKGSTCIISGLECYFADTFVFTYTEDGWIVEKKVPEKTFSFGIFEGDATYLQIYTDIPVDSKCVEFDIQRIGTKQDAGITVFQKDTQFLSFNYNDNHCSKGDTLKIKKGSTMKLQDGSVYVLRENWMFIFDGSAWSSAKETDITGIHSGAAGYLQPKLNAPAPTANGGTVVVKPDETGSDIFSASMSSHPVNGNALISINFDTAATSGKHYIWNADSIVKVESTQYYLDATYVFIYLDGQWQFYKGAFGDINEDGKTDSCDLVKIKKLLNDSAAYNIRYDLATDKKISDLDVKRERYILVGADWNKVEQSKELLLAENNFNGGGEFITFADCPPDPTDESKMDDYTALGFNTSLIAVNDFNTNQKYVTMDVQDIGYQLSSGEKELVITELKGYEPGFIQLRTNLPTGTDLGTFLDDSDQSVHDIKREGKRPSWYGYSGDLLTLYYVDNNKLVDGDTVTLKAGTKLRVDTVDYVLTQDYTFKFLTYYHDAIDTLKSLKLHAWLRNDSNATNYMTDDALDLLAPYVADVDGVYFADEPYWHQAEMDASNKQNSNQKENLFTFEAINNVISGQRFTSLFSDKYFHVNHVGVTAFNKYCEIPISEFNYTKYQEYMKDYATGVQNSLGTSAQQTTLGFDHYPFGYQTYTNNKKGLSVEGFVENGISPHYLITLLIPANIAKEEGHPISVAIQTFLKKANETNKRGIVRQAEITTQLYATMACGVDVYEYYLYGTLESQKQYGMVDTNGNKTDLYTYVQNANKEALPFADVLKTFTWQGAEFLTGNTSKNSEALKIVQNSNLSLLLNNNTDGVLTTTGSSADNDVLIGYYTKDGQDAYMIANYNDPKQVTNDNSVTLNFGDCNYARVYTGTANGLTSEIVSLNNGSYTFTLQPGGGCFVIPVNAAS